VGFDLYVELGGSSRIDVDGIVSGGLRNTAISNIATRIQLLAGTAALNGGVKEYAIAGDRKKGGGYKQLVHAPAPAAAPYTKELIQEELSRLNKLGLVKPSPALASLPLGSWFLQFEFILAKPWLSKDDDPFYVADSVNPVRKDKVFKIPVMAASSWKGLLRWAVMHVHLVEKRDELTVEEFAERRLAHTLLFGDEKGEEPDHSGRLMCYPTFFDLIDLEVINPHSRKTRAGTQPIYFECVPAGAKGTFSLLYVPFDLIGQPADEVKRQAGSGLETACAAITGLMLAYGFSAKRTSGFGAAEDTISGEIRTAAGSLRVTRLSKLSEEVRGVQF
jgi:CRISPR-associated protein Cmr2